MTNANTCRGLYKMDGLKYNQSKSARKAITSPDQNKPIFQTVHQRKVSVNMFITGTGSSEFLPVSI